MKKTQEKIANELQSLQNSANYSKIQGAVIHKYFTQDKRSAQRYFLTINGTTSSPTLNYCGMQNFMCGFIRAAELSRKEATA